MLNERYDEKDDIFKQRKNLLQMISHEHFPSNDNMNFASDDMDGDFVNTILGEFLQETQIQKLSQIRIQDSLELIGYSSIVLRESHLKYLEPISTQLKPSSHWENYYKDKEVVTKLHCDENQENNTNNSKIIRPSHNTARIINPLTECIDFQDLHTVTGVVSYTLAKMRNENRPLYDDQIRALKLLVSAHVSPGVKPLLMMLNGIAGSGKSTVLNSFRIALKYIGDHESMLVMAFTGAAAANVGGVTFNSVFGLLTKNFQPDKVKLTERLKKIQWLFFDEWSMMSTIQLYRISELISDILSDERSFGGLNVVLAGDPAQLPPNFQNGPALYRGFNLKFATHSDGKGDSIKGHLIRKQFLIVVQLRQSMRTEAVWYKAINQARYSSCDSESIATIRSVMLSNPDNKVNISNHNFAFKLYIPGLAM